MDKAFTTEDRFKLDKITFKPMSNYFASTLSPHEKEIVNQIEIKNIYRLYPIIYSISEESNLINIVNDVNERRRLSLFLEDIRTECENKGLEDRMVNFFVFSAATTWLFTYHLTNGTMSNLGIIGKVPPKGIFNKRQELANQWFIVYLTNLTINIDSLYLDCNSSKEMILPHFVSNTAYYLLKNMPNKFIIKENESANDTACRIFKEFLSLAKDS